MFSVFPINDDMSYPKLEIDYYIYLQQGSKNNLKYQAPLLLTLFVHCSVVCWRMGCRQSLYTFAQNQNDVGIVKWNYVTLSHCTNILYSLENTSQRQVQENGRQGWHCSRPQTTSNWIMRRIFAIFSFLHTPHFTDRLLEKMSSKWIM